MEKSEVSDTDAPAIRQAIHSSNLRAFLFAGEARRSEARRGVAMRGEKESGHEMYAGSNIRLNRRTIAAAAYATLCRSMWF